MAERKSVNKYYPPDWDPSKGSVNKYVGQHPLRDRAKKLGQGILVIRFEMPYNIWCGGCNAHIGMGVRYNAEKSKTGNYYTTPIYKFRMKCHLCDNYFEIQTDPKNHDYVILEGARRKEQRWDPKENGQIETEDKAVQKKMVTDPMFKLEHGSDDVQKGQKAKRNITTLETRRDEWKDDYILNKIARQKFREEKKIIKTEIDSDVALLGKSSLDIPLLKESTDDIKLAGLIKYRAIESFDEKQAKKRKEIDAQPFFELPRKVAKTHVDSKLDIIKNTLRDSKRDKRTNAFDRTQLNTLTTGSSFTKQSLGIRKKIPSTETNDKISTNFSINPTKSDSESLEKVNSDDRITVSDSECFDHVLTITNNISDKKLHETSPSECRLVNTLNGNKLVNIDNEVVERPTSNDTFERSIGSESENTETESRTMKSETSASDQQDKTDSISEINTDKTEQCHQNTALGLVCLYSDTDSDA